MMQFLKGAALLCTFLAALPSAAHLFELRGKMALDPATYFAAQSIYFGWAWFGIAVVLALMLNAWLGFSLVRRDGIAGAAALLSALLLLATLAIFFVAIQPANVATDNWTVAAAGWQRLRPRWEHGHALSGVLMLLALLLTIGAAVRNPQREPSRT